jgi:hypothetical protein
MCLLLQLLSYDKYPKCSKGLMSMEAFQEEILTSHASNMQCRVNGYIPQSVLIYLQTPKTTLF